MQTNLIRFYLACLNKDFDSINKLLDKGVNPNSNGCHILRQMDETYFDVFRLLFKRSIKICETSIVAIINNYKFCNGADDEYGESARQKYRLFKHIIRDAIEDGKKQELLSLLSDFTDNYYDRCFEAAYFKQMLRDYDVSVVNTFIKMKGINNNWEADLVISLLTVDIENIKRIMNIVSDEIIYNAIYHAFGHNYYGQMKLKKTLCTWKKIKGHSDAIFLELIKSNKNRFANIILSSPHAVNYLMYLTPKKDKFSFFGHVFSVEFMRFDSERNALTYARKYSHYAKNMGKRMLEKFNDGHRNTGMKELYKLFNLEDEFYNTCNADRLLDGGITLDDIERYMNSNNPNRHTVLIKIRNYLYINGKFEMYNHIEDRIRENGINISGINISHMFAYCYVCKDVNKFKELLEDVKGCISYYDGVPSEVARIFDMLTKYYYELDPKIAEINSLIFAATCDDMYNRAIIPYISTKKDIARDFVLFNNNFREISKTTISDEEILTIPEKETQLYEAYVSNKKLLYRRVTFKKNMTNALIDKKLTDIIIICQ